MEHKYKGLKENPLTYLIHTEQFGFDNCIIILVILEHWVPVVTKNASLLEMKAMEFMTSSLILTDLLPL